jgi:bifunctional non-homologous end joining protein LigD
MRLPKQLQLAQLVDEAPEGEEWLHEQKFDGYRILAELDRGRVRLLSRRFKDWTAQLPSIEEAVGTLPTRRALLDGEVAAVLPDGRTSFQALQNALGGRGASLVYFVFDVLVIDDDDLAAMRSSSARPRSRRYSSASPIRACVTPIT